MTSVVYGTPANQRGTNQVPGQPPVAVEKKEDGLTLVDDMVPIAAACCSISSCYCPSNSWRICGAFGQCEFLCLQTDFTCCKVSERPDDCCILQKARMVIIKPTTCIESQTQFFCCDHRCALPCNPDVPCMFNVFGLTCFYDYAFKCECCKKIGEIKPPVINPPTGQR